LNYFINKAQSFFNAIHEKVFLHCFIFDQGLSGYTIEKGPRIYDIDGAHCQSPPEQKGIRIDEVNYSGRCSGHNLALIVALSVVAGVVLFLVASFVVYKMWNRAAIANVISLEEQSRM